MASKLYSAEGLLRKHVLRGSSLRGRFEEMAEEAGVDQLKFTAKGFADAQEQIHDYRAKQLADALSLNELVSEKESKLARHKLEQKTKEEGKDFYKERAEYQKKLFSLKASEQKTNKEAARRYEKASADYADEVQRIQNLINQDQEGLSDYQVRLREQLDKVRAVAELAKFTDAYTTARKANIGREELISRLATGATSKAAQIEGGLSSATDIYSKSRDLYNKYINARDKQRNIWNREWAKREGIRKSLLWNDMMAQHPGTVSHKKGTSQQISQIREAGKKAGTARFETWKQQLQAAKTGEEVVDLAYDVQAWQTRKEAMLGVSQYA